MDTTLGEAKLMLIRLLDDEAVIDTYDPITGTIYESDLLKDGIHAALDALSVRLWKQSVLEIDETTDEITEGTRSYALPTSIIEIEAVYDQNLLSFIPRIDMAVGDSLLESTGNAWHTYPQGAITFTSTVSDSIKIFHSALWDKPDSDDDALEPPSISLTAILLYAASYCLLPASVGAADVGQFKTKVDSGRPVDNPISDMSNFFLKRFEIALQRIPQMQKGSAL